MKKLGSFTRRHKHTSSIVSAADYPILKDADWSIQILSCNGPISIEYCIFRSSNVGEGLLYVNH